MSRDGTKELDTGTVSLVDNLIDPTTGTIRLKAVFPNSQNKLWPGQYVNARVLVRTDRNALTIPPAALQRGPTGTFTYVVKSDSTVEARPVKVSEESGAVTVVLSGLDENEQVVTSNQYRLQPGAHVRISPAARPARQVAGLAAGEAPPVAAIPVPARSSEGRSGQ
jgi:multidrug efflux system membrane fusion protein